MKILRDVGPFGRETRCVGGIDVLLDSPGFAWMAPYSAIFQEILRSGGMVLFSDSEDGTPFFDSYPEALGHQIETWYCLVAGGMSARNGPRGLERERAIAVQDVDRLPPNDLEQVLLKDNWIALWSHDRGPEYDLAPVKRDGGDLVDVTEEILDLLIRSNDLVVKAKHDGNPIQFYGNEQSKALIQECIDGAEAALEGDPWVQANRHRFTWDEEHSTWEVA